MTSISSRVSGKKSFLQRVTGKSPSIELSTNPTCILGDGSIVQSPCTSNDDENNMYMRLEGGIVLKPANCPSDAIQGRGVVQTNEQTNQRPSEVVTPPSTANLPGDADAFLWS